MKRSIELAAGLAVLLGALPGVARAQSADDEAELLTAPTPDSGMSLKLSGFADFRYARFFSNDDPRWQQRGIPKNGSFSVGNLNLYLDGRLDQNFRSLLEVRFSYLPNGVALQGGSDPMSTGTGLYTDTLTYDYAQLRAKSQWGGIVIERAWLEYRHDQAFTLRGGQFLTPYGVWNVDHGSPTLIDISPPFIIGQELFPKSQVGLEAYGSFFLGEARLGYHATVSNGRIGRNPQYLDYDTNLGLGGRVFLEAGWLGEMKLGASVYAGKYTDKQKGLQYTAIDMGGGQVLPVFVPWETKWSGRELDVAGDLRWDVGGLTFIGEYIEQRLSDEEQTITSGAGAPVVTRQDPFTKRGWYGLIGYRLPGAVMPFGVVQYINDSRGDWAHDPKQEAYAWTGGVNWRVRPNVVVKASYTRASWPKTPKTLENKDPLSWVTSQVAWAF